MPLLHVESMSDERVACYRNLKDRELAREGGLFIAEGEHVVKRLLESELAVASVLVASSKMDRITSLLRESTNVYVAAESVVNDVLGFKFHSGMMACGVRPVGLSITSLVDSWTTDATRQRTLLICPQVINHDNLGSLIRIGAAFGVDAMVLGPTSCDPFWRRSVRVSMGTVFRLPIVRSDDLTRDMNMMRNQAGVELIATVIDDDAQPLHRSSRAARVGVVVGNESQGLLPSELAWCDRRVTIPMKLGTDSLNIAVATGVALYHFTQGCENVSDVAPR
jgi:tRNA G18 (ribose-2'-O)-methylase SpoU